MVTGTRTATVAVIGAGPAGLMAAEKLAAAGHKVIVFDAMPSPGRKLLMAGRGGLNLTHSEPLEPFLMRYGGAAPQLAAAIEAYPPAALVDWANDLGQPTFVGSSGRVFPKCLKASPLLRAWLARLVRLGVELRMRHRWTGWTDDGALRFMTEPGGTITIHADATLLALGGASWPRLGSDGRWMDILQSAGVLLTDLAPANAGVRVAWTAPMASRFAGTPVKRIAVRFGGIERPGEAVITRSGLEGGVIYAFSREVREALARGEVPMMTIDLKPGVDAIVLMRRLARPRGGASTANHLRKAAGLGPEAVALMREATGNALPGDPAALAGLIKAVPIAVTGLAGL
ncbi:MAG: TIGR03862 family flavoprotein, partial [Hyphomicrobium sp.]